MRTVQQYREMRRRQQELGKFHAAHFPIGTVFEFEDPRADFILEENRRHPNETHGRSIATVTDVMYNGPDSLLIEYNRVCTLTNNLNHINASWVRRIISRGDGTLSEYDQTFVDMVRAKHKAEMAKYHVSRGLNFADGLEPTNGNNYTVHYLREFVSLVLSTHPKYKADFCDHLYDLDKMIDLVYKFLGLQERGHWEPWVINKKRFHKAMRMAMARGKISRRKEAGRQHADDMRQYERDMEKDYDEGNW